MIMFIEIVWYKKYWDFLLLDFILIQYIVIFYIVWFVKIKQTIYNSYFSIVSSPIRVIVTSTATSIFIMMCLFLLYYYVFLSSITSHQLLSLLFRMHNILLRVILIHVHIRSTLTHLAFNFYNPVYYKK